MSSLFNHEKRKPSISKTVKANGQRTLLDMFGKKKVEKQVDSQETESTSSARQIVNEEDESQIDESVIPPDSPDTAIDSIGTAPTTPKSKASEIPAIGPDTAFKEFSDSDEDPDDPLLSEDQLPGTQHAPIIIDSSPIKAIIEATEVEMKKTKTIVHPFFAPRAKVDNSTSPTSAGKLHTKDLEAAYPDRESQHIKGIQPSYASPPCPFAGRRHANGIGGSARRLDCSSVLDFLLPCEIGEDGDPCDDDGVTSRITEAEESIDESLIRKHPAIERAVEAGKSGDGSTSASGQLWADAWRPRCAKEVLGNERCAIYLRNWLHTLGVQLKRPESEDTGKKKKKKVKKRERVVIREVPRKKARRDGLEGFLVEDDDEDDDDVDPKEWEEEFKRGSEERELESVFASDVAEAINGRLHNTILLTGPHGCGKTAAVFACAEELGWDVFEVYPGIGRRNGANVDNLVGEVGKNHLIKSRTEEGSGGVRQSLILLEEVDLVFKEDVNFWTGVSNLIKECRRPVICTCNDASLVPMSELPLQKVLYFEGVGREVGMAYLQGVACAEGYEGRIVREMYEGDLRRAMHRIEMECRTGGRIDDDEENGEGEENSEDEEEEEEWEIGEVARGDLRWKVFRGWVDYRALVEGIGWVRGPGRTSDWTERVAVLRGMGRVVLSGGAGERRRRGHEHREVDRVGRRELGAACSGMEWQRGVAGL